MKTLHLAILAVTGLFLVFTVTFHVANAFCGVLNPDWPKYHVMQFQVYM
ncbi:MAG: hypothetical protein KGI27_11335 [Thaumarchaeota archaeon]|nr:hypothetical protein [Nitrososphaerota archaeon]